MSKTTVPSGCGSKAAATGFVLLTLVCLEQEVLSGRPGQRVRVADVFVRFGEGDFLVLVEVGEAVHFTGGPELIDVAGRQVDDHHDERSNLPIRPAYAEQAQVVTKNVLPVPRRYGLLLPMGRLYTSTYE